jgi:hypothetical protein
LYFRCCGYWLIKIWQATLYLKGALGDKLDNLDLANAAFWDCDFAVVNPNISHALS